MKFKDLEVGQMFKPNRKAIGTLVKIKPEKVSGGMTATHKEIGTNIRGWHVKPNDNVIIVDSKS